MSSADPIVVDRPEGEWTIHMPAEKLATRAALPGAYTWDRSAQALRTNTETVSGASSALPLAFASSWLVNNKVPSPVFHAWQAPLALRHWRGLLGVLHGVDTGSWSELASYKRDMLAAQALALCIEGHGAAALSKVLALLCPDLVPLMDDAAIAFATGGVDAPETADRPSADHSHVLPMLDWFADAVERNRPALDALAAEVDPAGSSAAQILDRLLWFESWGYRLFARATPSWWWVRTGDARHEQGIVRLETRPLADADPSVAIALDAITDERVAAHVRDAIAGG